MELSNLRIPSIRTKSIRHGLAQLLFACCTLLLTTDASAGSLTPPAGAVVSTMKRLDEVEPRTIINAANTPGDAGGSPSIFKISAPGSYYLTGNILGASGKLGIEIVSSDVTLDLNGFEVLGVAGSLDGIGVTVSGLTNIAILNGTVRSWGLNGVNVAGFGSVNCRVQGVLSSGNVNYGISVGDDSTVADCSATGNGAAGIVATKGSTVTNSSALLNIGDGIVATVGCTVTGCAAANNSNYGIFVTNGSTVTNSSASFNGGSGIGTGEGSTVFKCSAFSNSGRGVLVTGVGTTVADCTIRANVLDGILCDSQCLIRGNNCVNNGAGAGIAAGIHVTGSDNRIEGNNCVGADRGIDVDSGGNFITRNTCSGNTTNNWDIAAGNVILVVNATTGGAFAGNSGGVAPGSTDPNANFTY